MDNKILINMGGIAMYKKHLDQVELKKHLRKNKITLKNKPSHGLRSKNELFVFCDQLECQYIDFNQSPCPLRLDLFAEEIEKRKDRRMGF